MADDGSNAGGLRVMGDHEDRLAEVTVQLGEDGEGLLHRFGVEISGRSGAEQQGWIGHQCVSDGGSRIGDHRTWGCRPEHWRSQLLAQGGIIACEGNLLHGGTFGNGLIHREQSRGGTGAASAQEHPLRLDSVNDCRRQVREDNDLQSQ